MAFIFLGIASYFLIAAFVPRIRMRWGFSKSVKMTVLKPHMGAVTCVGMTMLFATFFASFLWSTRSLNGWSPRS